MMLRLIGCATPPPDAPQPVATAAPTQTAPMPPLAVDDEFCPLPVGWFVYVVQPGDTIRSVAARTNSTAGELAFANCLNNPRSIASGTRFYIPQQLQP